MTNQKPIYLNNEKSKYVITDDCKVINTVTGNEIKIRINNSGYGFVSLNHNNKSYTRFIHRLFAEAFIPNPDNKRTVDHLIPGKEGKMINNINSLRWATDKENVQSAWNNGLCQPRRGEKSNFAKYSVKEIKKVCKMLENKVPVIEISNKTKVSYHTIRDILFYGTWKNISSEYNIDKEYYRQLYHKHDLTEEQQDQIKKLFEKDLSLKPKKICKILNINYSNKVRKEIYQIKDKVKGSTTIENTDNDNYLYEIKIEFRV